MLCFWVEDSLLQKYHPTTDPWKRLVHITRYNGFVELHIERDLAWIKENLRDQSRIHADRALLLEAALYLISPTKNRHEQLAELKLLIQDKQILITEIDKNLQPRKPTDWEIKAAKEKEQQKIKEAENRAGWIQFRHEIINDTDNAFSQEQGLSTAWNLWQVMSCGGENNGVSVWNRPFIEDQFNIAIADKLRIALMKAWRKEKPTLPSERPENERNIVNWQFGLAAIYAEAEDPSWATKLTTQEAELAAKYAPVELNRLPYWLESLVISHPNAVDNTLGRELSWELGQNTEASAYSMLLQKISHTAEPVIRLFIPRITNWLDANKAAPSNTTKLLRYAERLKQVTNVLLQYGNQEIHQYLLGIALEQLSNSLPDELILVWLPVVMQLETEAGVSYLEQKLHTIQPSKYSLAVQWFGELFGDRHDALSLSVPNFTPDLLLRLLRLAYYHVKRDEDDVHEGTYTPDTRDHAETARNSL